MHIPIENALAEITDRMVEYHNVRSVLNETTDAKVRKELAIKACKAEQGINAGFSALREVLDNLTNTRQS